MKVQKTRRRISNTVLQPGYWGSEAGSRDVCRLLGRFICLPDCDKTSGKESGTTLRQMKIYYYWTNIRKFSKVVPMGAIVIRTRFDEGTESAEVATSGDPIYCTGSRYIVRSIFVKANSIHSSIVAILELIRGANVWLKWYCLPAKKCDA
jgi:hypothetical protein